MLSRRSFLAILAAAPAAIGAVPHFKLQHGEALLIEAHVAGYRFYDGPSIEPALHADEPLVLRRESRNAHDPSAIAVLHRSGAMLGYIPRAMNAVSACLMDQGRALHARIRAIEPSPAPPWERLTIAVFIE
jgi:hypothetical protein